MTRLTLAFQPLGGPSKEELRSLFIDRRFLQLMQSLRAREVELSLKVGRAMEMRNGVPVPTSDGANLFSELEKTRHTLDTLERIIEQKLDLTTTQHTIA